MPQVGRPSASRGVFSFEGIIPPPEAVLDTTFVVEALVASQPAHAECSAFLEAMAAVGTVIYFNRLLEVELWEAAYQIAIREAHGGRAAAVRADGRVRRRGETLRRQTEDAWRELLYAFDSVIVGLEEVSGAVPILMKLGLKSYDAIHVATAVVFDVRSLVTLDRGFAFAPDSILDLYVPTARMRSFRERRAQQPRTRRL
jgi:predicted nucleic acid-binding protein